MKRGIRAGIASVVGGVVGLGLAGAVGCAGGGSGGMRTPVRVVRPATDVERGALIERVKALAGEWEGDGAPGVASVFAVSSGGSVVREIMFPGQAHEMTNVYHMDGPALVMTHYCAAGNQPRMVARGGGAEIRFERDSVSNLGSAGETYMAEMTLVFVDADHVRQVWRSYQDGAAAAEPMTFDLRRRK